MLTVGNNMYAEVVVVIGLLYVDKYSGETVKKGLALQIYGVGSE